MKHITQEQVKELFVFYPETGNFHWKKCLDKRLIGKQTGELIKTGAVIIRTKYGKFQAHRLAWLYMFGYFPKFLDHINGIRSDNRICNLRECTHAENHQNKGIQSNNTSGYPGVGWHKLTQKWRAYITLNRKQISLGSFDDKESAYKAYCEAKAKYHTFCPTHR